ncbi:hypothetical protein DICVIV_04797 [Dictyocaulus viviparus]|uniref:THAP-type domain-containing protein n=1 Tax=Dictyocaulus viviparus TaxID=29172 RepID=A0A0D8XX52_DICVI|nr:hypothetical protein DICVIV_04797 [Dictyocaulus viviparus]
MARATKSSVSGEMLRISKRPDGKLSIFACESERTSPSDMLRLRDGSVMLSAGHICTDHFSEECFRVFNFNKAAIEALGMPSVVSPGVRLTPSKKWFLFRRIFETSRANCRSSLLEPVMKWSSWTDRNVYLAYHGCEPPPRTPRKRPCEDISTQFGSSDNRNVSSNILHNLPNWRIVESSSKYPLSAKAIFLPIVRCFHIQSY